MRKLMYDVCGFKFDTLADARIFEDKLRTKATMVLVDIKPEIHSAPMQKRLVEKGNINCFKFMLYGSTK